MITGSSTLVGKAREALGPCARPAGPDDRVDGVAPAVVVDTDSTALVAAALAWASDARLSVVVRGGGTRDRWGRRPRPFDVLIRLDRLNRLVAHEASDLTATIEAGATLRDVNAALARHGQQLPLDGLQGEHGTIGGLVATNHAGPMRHRYGTPRDLVIGMTVVLGDGLTAKSGGRVVKNVAGYDLARMMSGSHGTLGVITQVTFKLAPLAPVSRTVRIDLRHPADAVAFADLLRQAQCEPDALDFRFEHGDDQHHAPLTVFVRFASVAPAVDDGCRHARRAALEVDGRIEMLPADAAAECWRGQMAFNATGTTMLRLSWKPAELARAAETLRTAARGVPFVWTGRLGVGAGTVTLGGSPDDHPAVVEQLRRTGALRHVLIVDAPAEVRERIDPWQIEPDTEALWQALKGACDPHGTLGAGRGPV
ncbi:MAG: FAD-binding oxidoreductase [Acidobacteriota bacterium]|nr:MAG: hypothetical protein DIU54_05020 [Acidobacteriota bacterium]